MRGVEHRLWLGEPPLTTSTWFAELPLDDDFEMRVHAARRIWRVLNGKPPGPHTLSSERRQGLALALRARDAGMGGNT
jgi:T6SS, Transcription factor, DNA binding domain